MPRKAQKTKIAIAIDNGLLSQLDALIDGVTLTSRSQAIGHFLHKSLAELTVTHGVILLHSSHHGDALGNYEGKPLLEHQLRFFLSHGIRTIYVVTQEGPQLEHIQKLGESICGSAFHVELSSASGTAGALASCQKHLSHVPFLAMSGDTLNIFDLSKMALKHVRSGKLATMGLVNKEDLTDCGVVLLDGESIISIETNAPNPKSHIINAGIYVFRPEIFGMLTEHMESLEKDLFPQLASIQQLQGHFTHGTYVHVPELE